jgi:hypothetical protein
VVNATDCRWHQREALGKRSGYGCGNVGLRFRSESLLFSNDIEPETDGIHLLFRRGPAPASAQWLEAKTTLWHSAAGRVDGLRICELKNIGATWAQPTVAPSKHENLTLNAGNLFFFRDYPVE